MVKRNALGQSVVCSEKTKARGKVKSIALAVATASAMLASVDAVAATTLGENQTIADTTSVAIGNNVIATGADTVAVGDYTKATGEQSTALGERATTFGNQATATGSYAFADGNQSTSNGHASSAMAIDTIAIGVNSGAAGGSMSKEDWDKLIVIDREIKELDPSQFTKTVTTPGGTPTEPDRTRLTMAEQNKPTIATTEFARTISPAPMFYGLDDGVGDTVELANVMNIHTTSQVTGELGSFYTRLLSAGLRYNDLNYDLMYAMPRGEGLWAFAEGVVSNPDFLLTETARGNQYNTSVTSAVGHYYTLRDVLNMDGRASDFDPTRPPGIAFPTTDEEMAAAEEKYAYLYDAATRAGNMVSPETLRSEYARIKNLAVQNLDQQAIDIAVSFFNGTATQNQVDAYASSPDKVQQLKDAMVVTQALKQIRTSYSYLKNHVGLNKPTVQQTGAGSIGGAYGEEVKTTWDFREVDPNTLFGGALPTTDTGVDGSATTNNIYIQNLEMNGGIEAMRAAYNELKAAREEYNTALAEYEAAVAAGGTGGTTTTTTDLAAYEGALAEKRAELTKLANAAGFDGTFESLSDVFGSKAGRAIAIGNSAYVSGDESVGVGYGNKVTGNQANVFGTHNTVTGDNNNVVGNNNTVATAGNNILGNAVTFAAGVATVGNVALGNDSVIGAAVPTSSIDIRGTTYNFAGTNPTSVVTVGSAGKERQITNVAAGQVTATSTDTINGSQLYAVVKAVEDLEAGSADTNTDKSVRVKSDSNLLTVTGAAGAADGITTMTDYTVSLNKGTFGTDPATGEVTAPTDGVATTADVADAINSGSFVVTAGGTKLADVGFGDTLSFVDGNGTKAVVKNGGVAYDLNVKSTDGSIVTKPNTDGSLSISVNTSVLPKTVVDAGKGIDVTPVTNGNTTTYTVAVDDTIADKQFVADEIAKIKIPEVDLSGLITYEESVIAGDNITVSQDSKNSSGGKEFKVSLNSTLTGIDKIGGGTGAGSSISFGDNTINAGGSTISNIANPTNATDAATKAYVDDKATTVAKGDGISVTTKTTTTPSGAVNTEYTVALDDATKAQLAKEESVSAGSNIVVKQDKVNSTGGNNYNVSLAADLTGISSISNGDTTVKLGDGAVNVGGSTITNVASPVNATDAVNKAYVDNSKTTVSKGDGITVTATQTTKDGATSVDYAVALDDSTKATLAQVDVNKAAIAKGINTTADDGKVTNHPLGGIVAVLGDGKNIKTSTTDTGAISVQMADNLKVNSVMIEGTSVGMGAGGISAGGNKIYNVAPGTISPSSTDAINGSQLYQTNMNVAQNTQSIGVLKERMDEFDDALDAQAAGARAALGIPQVTLPGKSMVGVGLGNYGDAQALAVGFSRLSDNARTILKGSIDANTKDTNKFGVSLGLGFQW